MVGTGARALRADLAQAQRELATESMRRADVEQRAADAVVAEEDARIVLGERNAELAESLEAMREQARLLVTQRDAAQLRVTNRDKELDALTKMLVEAGNDRPQPPSG